MKGKMPSMGGKVKSGGGMGKKISGFGAKLGKRMGGKVSMEGPHKK